MHTTKAYGMGPLPAMVEELAGFPALERTFRASGLSLSLLDHRDTRIPLESMHRLYDVAAREVGDADFGLRVGQRMDPFSYGDWGNYLSSGRTLGGAIRRMNRTRWIHQSGTELFLSRKGDYIVWRYKRDTINAENRAQHSLHVLPTMIALIRMFLGQSWLPGWIEFDFSKPAQTGAIEEAFPVTAIYGQTALGVAIPSSALSARRLAHQQRERVVTYSDLVIANDSDIPDDLRDISGLIGMRLLDGDDDMEGLARRLEIGPRTLQRRLIRQGSSYRVLLERAKLHRAMSLLRETDMTILEIALSLGYKEPGNFTRAFKKLANCTPSEFRIVGQVGF